MKPTPEDILILDKLKEAGVVIRGKTLKGDTFRGTLWFHGILPFIPSWGYVCTINRTPGMKLDLPTLTVEVEPDKCVPVAEWFLTIT